MVDGAPLDIGGGHFLDVRRPAVLDFLFQFMPRGEWNEYTRIAKIRLRGRCQRTARPEEHQYACQHDPFTAVAANQGPGGQNESNRDGGDHPARSHVQRQLAVEADPDEVVVFSRKTRQVPQ
jgi:hypothetical protein